MKVYEYKEGDKWCYQTDNQTFKCDLRHSMQSLKDQLGEESLSVSVERGTAILYGGMRFSERNNQPNYNI